MSERSITWKRSEWALAAEALTAAFPDDDVRWPDAMPELSNTQAEALEELIRQVREAAKEESEPATIQ